MEATLNNLTPEQRSNLKKLSTYLSSGRLQAIFDMHMYNDDSALEVDRINCGTIGCALGHGPYAGIPKKIGERWLTYAENNFTGNYNFLWQWLFSSHWVKVDNTAIGAAQRIEYFLKHGLPAEDEIFAMMDGDIPLIYKQ